MLGNPIVPALDPPNAPMPPKPPFIYEGSDGVLPPNGCANVLLFVAWKVFVFVLIFVFVFVLLPNVFGTLTPPNPPYTPMLGVLLKLVYMLLVLTGEIEKLLPAMFYPLLALLFIKLA